MAVAQSSILEETPSEIELDDVSKIAGDKWRSLLTHLGVPMAKCKALSEESQGKPVSACFEGLVFWRDGNEPCRSATWSVLLEALEKGAEKREYAKTLRQRIVYTAVKGEETAYPPNYRNEHGNERDLVIKSVSEDVVSIKTETSHLENEVSAVRSSHRIELEKEKDELARERAEFEEEKAELEREKARFLSEKSVPVRGKPEVATKKVVPTRELQTEKSQLEDKEAAVNCSHQPELTNKKTTVCTSVGLPPDEHFLPNSNPLGLPPTPDNLEIVEQISGRACWAVFRGLLGDKEVAVKKVNQFLLHCTEQSAKKTLNTISRERELLQAARDPHIVEFLGAFNDECSGPLLVMELMDQTLGKYLEDNRGKLSKNKQVDICQQIASGLRFLHRCEPQILHYDLTSKNVLLKGNKVKVSDIGKPKFSPSDLSYNQESVPYMPPECFSDNPHYDDKGDVFSLGVVMLETATQQPPAYLGGAMPEMKRRANDLSQVPDDHPLKALIRNCLKDNPKERPTIEEVHSELHQLQPSRKSLTMTINMSDLHAEFLRISNMKLQSEMMKKEPQLFRSDVLLKGNQLQSVHLPPLPIPTCRATAVVIGEKIYVSGGVCIDVEHALLVQVYNTKTAEWTTLPSSPIYRSESTLVKGQLTLIGGQDASTGEFTDSTSTWDEENKQWFANVPPMPTKRVRPSIIHCNNLMLVAGGIASDKTHLETVDVFDMETFQWTTAGSFKLPLPLWAMQTSIGRDYVYIGCGRDKGGEGRTKELGNDVAYKLPVDNIVSAIHKNEEVKWIQLQNTPNFRSGLVADSDHPIVVGGNDKSGEPTSDVSIYDPTTDKWSNVGQCVRRHLRSCVIAISSSSFVVIGGCANHKVPKHSLIDNFELFYV